MPETQNGTRALLEEIIAEARKLLTDYDEYLRGNETATRALVIDRVLTALGWDIKDPARVLLEYRSNGNKVDYVLLSSSGKFIAIVEAKSADSGPKETDRRQASGYATEIGARFAVLTNGGRWEAWEMVQEKPRKDSILVEVHLTTGEIPKIASTLEKLHRDTLEQQVR
ncbi:MAG: type I restriction enzyme HsdR N-terminal domain-containing protein [Boseongicola sp.]|nr:type I restriction enzyme HsdR N-terminal domain-containing protein [Boseongicola sp.]